MCEVIIFRNSKYDVNNVGGSIEDKRNAQVHLNALESLSLFMISSFSNELLFT